MLTAIYLESTSIDISVQYVSEFKAYHLLSGSLGIAKFSMFRPIILFEGFYSACNRENISLLTGRTVALRVKICFNQKL